MTWVLLTLFAYLVLHLFLQAAARPLLDAIHLIRKRRRVRRMRAAAEARTRGAVAAVARARQSAQPKGRTADV